ncbi:Fe(3+) dicitrate transport protein FecA [Klebsiella pneumoniae]|nr:Fe(3+) dicitrate transport protein FecA [Klebsiella pneumoniae]
MNAEIREKGDTYGNQVTFSPKHKGTLGVDYKPGNWTFNLNSDFQSSQFADNANTVKERRRQYRPHSRLHALGRTRGV